MSAVQTKVPLTLKEAEGLLWGFSQIGDYAGDRALTGAAEPVAILRKMGYKPKAISECCEALMEFCYARCLTDPFTELEQAILRLAVENSSWVYHYNLHFPEQVKMANEARAALRSLAEKLDLLGIEVNYLPQD